MTDPAFRTLWVGPVSAQQVHAPAGTGFVQCIGAPDASQPQTDICRDDVAKIASHAPGEKIALRAFSAGGHAIKRYLLDPAARDRVIAVVLSDASFEDVPGTFAEGFATYASEAARGEPGRVFVATAGSVGASTHGVTDSASLESLRLEIERRTGLHFQPLGAPWAPRPPARAWQLGRVALLDFGSAYQHAEHATLLAPLLWDNVVAPLLEGGGSAPMATPTPSSYVAAAARHPAPPHQSSTPSRSYLPAVLVSVGVGLVIYALGRET